MDNPCMTCGACCAYFRVSFYANEPVPDKLTERFGAMRRCMRGTNQHHPHCVYLKGIVGESVACTCYDERPSPCRNFSAYTDRCNGARHAYNLPPLPVLYHEEENLIHHMRH